MFMNRRNYEVNKSQNNVGVLRLFFAVLVIIGHAPEMTDGNRLREPLSAVFGTLSLGSLSVDSFFLLSGFLITKSMTQAKSLKHYLLRRILRIYPAFTVSYLLCVFAMGPLVGARPLSHLGETFGRLLFLLAPPDYPGQLPGVAHYATLNGAMWSIAYEFRCYMLVGILGVTGFLHCRRSLLSVTITMLVCHIFATFTQFQHWLFVLGNNKTFSHLVGDPTNFVRLSSVFLVGSCFYLYRSEIERFMFAPFAACTAIISVCLLYHDPHFAEVSYSIFGGFTLFYVAYRTNLGPLQQINNRYDFSYGTYLYGWPVAIFILWLNPLMSPWILASLSMPIAIAFGAFSWWGIERRVKNWAEKHGSSSGSLKEADRIIELRDLDQQTMASSSTKVQA